jgi:hypothetical protein
MLPSRIPNARIMRYGYQSAWHGAEVTEQGTSLIAPRVIRTKTSLVAQRFLQALVRKRKLSEVDGNLLIIIDDKLNSSLETSKTTTHHHRPLFRWTGRSEG